MTAGAASAAGPGARREDAPKGTAAQVAWTLTEAANEPFFTLIRSYVFSAYFVGTLALTKGDGQAAWGLVQGVGGLLVAVLAPALGAFADTAGPRKPWIAAFAALSVTTCAGLWFAVPGTPLWQVSLAVLAATVAVEIMLVFTNACLPSIAGPRRTGLLSGATFGFGQLAGIGALLLVVYLSDNPLSAFAGEPNAVDRAAGPIAAAAIVLFLLPLFLLMPDEPRRATARADLAREGLGTLWRTLRSAAAERNMRLFMIGRAFGTDGMTTIFAFGGILAADAFGWRAGQLATFGIVVTACAAAGGFVGGLIDARIGSRRALVGGLVTIGVGAAGLLTTDATHLFAVAVAPSDGPAFTSPQELGFVASAIVIALGAGPVHGAMRGLMARIAPLERMTAYFGVYALVGKATNFIGPLVVGAVAASVGSLRLGLTCAFVFLAIGIWAFSKVREERSVL